MALRSTATTWGSVTKALHWLIALGVIGLATVGWIMKGLPLSPTKIQVYALHKSVGLTVFALVLVRLAWRIFIDTRPELPAGMPQWERRAAVLSHVLLYVVLLAMPLSGWLFNSAANFPLKWFNLFSVPSLAAPDPALKAFAGLAHFSIFWLIAVLVTVHVAAALKHHFVDRDFVLARMLPWRTAAAKTSI
jgi:cytochrome b561